MILQATPENIAHVSALLRAGEVIAIPTETVYGLAGNALDPNALAKIFQAKERPTFDPLIVHISDEWKSEALEGLSKHQLVDLTRMSPLARERASKLIEAYWPGPLTLVLPKNPKVPDLATAGLPSVALRMPKHPVAQAVLKASKLSLAAPSANRFGKISPTRAEHVVSELQGRIPHVVDGGPCEIGVESTVVSIAPDGAVAVLRPGKISSAEIETFLLTQVGRGLSGEAQALQIAPGAAAPAPGMLESHYAPEKPLHLLKTSLSAMDSAAETYIHKLSGKKVGILIMNEATAPDLAILERRFQIQCVLFMLSQTGVTEEIAQNLFAGLRTLDQSDSEILISEPCPSTAEGLAHAIQDRLTRAAAKRS